MLFILLSLPSLFGQIPDFSWAVYGNAGAVKVVVDPDQNSVLTGNFYSSGTFGPGLAYSAIPTIGSYDIFLEKLDSTGAVRWLRTLGSSESEMVGGVATDVDGNIYLAGNFWGEIDVDPGNGVYEITPTEGFDDLFVLKLNSNGEFVWVKTFGSFLFDNASGIKVDIQGNIYITGSLGDDVNDMDPGVGEYAALYYGGHGDGFIMKLDVQGNFLWINSIGGGQSDFMNDMAFDDLGNVYTTGKFYGTANCSCDTSFISQGSTDAFVQKFNASGGYEWGYSLGSLYEDSGNAIQVDETGNILVTGNFSLTVDLDPGLVIDEHFSNGSAVFIQKLRPDGTLIWAKTISGSANYGEYPSDLVIDKENNLYLTGYFYGSINLGTNLNPMVINATVGTNTFVHKMDSNGIAIWGMSVPSYSRGNSLALDASANVYVTGSFDAPVDFDPSDEEFMVHRGIYFLMRLGLPTDHIRWDDPYYYPENTITLYPNPTIGEVTITQLAKFDLTIEIFDYLGRSIRLLNSSELKTTLDITDFEQGIYWFKIRYADSMITQQIVKTE
ncbi:MAG: hypothetical protein A3D31_02255 [Candidatus Fluviicola riflensis]|nr:MAG: hypothetical protein A3D31_02255 [Candidatus Fluviicola riflensis]OGS86249.1 MAG: hypothetical protein A2724_01710 [Fluviicola sp. RIFCSPHIGHO2_01_FULL_43_53]